MGTIPVEGKTVAIAVMIAAVLSAAGGGGSAAFFADTAASQDNSISAGEWVEDVDLKVSPNPIEAGSQGTPVQVKIAQPNDGEIDPDTVDVELASAGVSDDPQTTNPQWSIHALDRQAVIDAVDGDPGSYTITVSGDLEDGGTFEGSTELTVKSDSGSGDGSSANVNATNQTVTTGNATTDTGNTTTESGNTTDTAGNVSSDGAGNVSSDGEGNETQRDNSTTPGSNDTAEGETAPEPDDESAEGNETTTDSQTTDGGDTEGETGNESETDSSADASDSDDNGSQSGDRETDSESGSDDSTAESMSDAEMNGDTDAKNDPDDGGVEIG